MFIADFAAAAIVVAPPAPVSAPAPVTASAVHCLLPRDTPVTIEIEDAVDSSVAAEGDRFRVVLAEPISVGGAVLVKAGASGSGEVIHARRAKGAGKAGELIVTARYLEFGATRARLRGFTMGGAGQSEAEGAFVVAMFTGPLGFAVKGGELVLPVGRRASARLADDVVLPGACPGQMFNQGGR